MAQTSEVILNVKTGNAEKNVGNVSKQIREYTNNLRSLDSGTEEYNSTLQKLADLNSVVYKTQQDINAASLNNYQVFQNATSAVSGLVGGFTAFNSVIALAGVENERLTETFVKLQAGVSFVSSLNALSGGLKSLMLIIPRLRTMVAALSATIAANPFGAVLAGITAITVATGLLIRRFSDTETSVNSLKDSFDKFNESLDKSEKAFNDQIELAKAYGAEIDELQQREIDYLNTTSREIQATIDSLNNKLESLGPSSKFANWFFGNVDIYANRRAEIESEISELTESLTGVNTKLEIAQVTSNRRIEGEEKRAAEERRKIAERAYQERLKQQQQFNDDLQSIQDNYWTVFQNSQKSFSNNIVSEARGLLQSINEEIEDFFVNNPDGDIPLFERLDTFTDLDNLEARKIAYKNELAMLWELANDEYAAFDVRIAAREQYDRVKERSLEFDKKYAATRKKLINEDIALQQYQFTITSNLLGAASALLGSNTAAAKTISVASALFSSYAGAAQVLADPSLPFIAKIAAYSSILTAGLSAVASIRSVKIPGAASSDNVYAPTPYTPEISSAMYEPEPTPYVRELQGQEDRTLNVTTTISEDDIQSSENRININSNEGGLNSQNKRAA